MAKIRNRYNQAPHMTQDTNGKVTNSQLFTTNESQEVRPFPTGDYKAQINRRAQRHNKQKTEKHKISEKEVMVRYQITCSSDNYGIHFHRTLLGRLRQSSVQDSTLECNNCPVVKICGKCPKISNTNYLHTGKMLRQNSVDPDQICYSGKHFVDNNPANQHFYWKQKELNVGYRNYRELTVYTQGPVSYF